MYNLIERAWRDFFLSVIACTITGAVFGIKVALLLFCLIVCVYHARHLRSLKDLIAWLKKPDITAMPKATGVWEEVFTMLYQYERRHQRSLSQVNSALERFIHAASALPDGVVLLNLQNTIEWCNKPAEKLLGLSTKKDLGQKISYLIRHAGFLEYLDDLQSKDAFKMKSWLNHEVMLEFNVMPFQQSHKLLTVRDISQMEKIDHIRRDFIANVSHELRTPLTVVGGFLETLTDMDDAVPEHLRGYFGMMQEQTSRMRTLIEDLLTLSQLENSVGAHQESEVDVSGLLHTILAEANSISAGRHQISLKMESDTNIKGSLQEIHSAFGNLVTNAIRYTPDGGAVVLRWRIRESGEGVFSVQDTGIGIEQKHIDRITERFYRVDKSRSRDTGGTGLGLSIVKHILTRHQAHLEIMSEFGRGSLFSVVFPVERVIAAGQADKLSS